MNTLFPNHPAYVHFPLGLLAGAFLFELLGLIFKKPALHDVGRANLFMGTLAALVAVGTGLWGVGLVTPKPPGLEKMIDNHQTLAFASVSLAVVMCMWRVSLRKKYEGGARTMFVAGLGVLAALILFTGHLGGRMVYEHGAAVTVGKRAFGSPALPAESLTEPTPGSPGAAPTDSQGVR